MIKQLSENGIWLLYNAVQCEDLIPSPVSQTQLKLFQNLHLKILKRDSVTSPK